MRRFPWLFPSLAGLLTLGLLAGLLMVGCGQGQKPEPGGVPRTKEYRRVISLAPGVTELIMDTTMGIPVLIGRTASCNYPAQAKPLPVVAGVKPDYEKIKGMRPDLIVYDGALYSKMEIDEMKRLIDTDYYALDSPTVDGFIDQLYVLADKLASEITMSDYIDKIQNARSAAQASAPNPKRKVAIVMPGHGGEHMIAGMGTFQADLVRAGGGEPIGPDAPNFVMLNAEAFVRMNPDVIITVGKPDAVYADTRFKTIGAIKTGHIFGIDGDLLLRRGNRVDMAIDRIHVAVSGK